MKATTAILCLFFSVYVCRGQEHASLGGPLFAKDDGERTNQKKTVIIPNIADDFKFDSVIDSIEYIGHYKGRISVLVLRRDPDDKFSFKVVASQDLEIKGNHVGQQGKLDGLQIKVKTGDVIGLYAKKKILFNFQEDTDCSARKGGYASVKPLSIEVGSDLTFKLFRKGQKRCRKYPIIINYRSQGCGPLPLDVYFVVDISKSIKDPELETERQTVKYFFNHFDVSDTSTRIGVIKYKDTTEKEIALEDLNSREELNAAALLTRGSLDDQKAGTRTDLAMNMMMDEMAVAAASGRSQACILLTDGRSTASSSEMTAMVNRLRDTGILTIAVGIGKDADTEELEYIASGEDQDNVYFVSNIHQLRSIAQSVVSDVCEDGGGEPPLPPPVCKDDPLDVYLVVDISKSISEKELAAERAVVRLFFNNLNIGADAARVGLIKYHRYEELEFNLDQYTSREDLLAAELLTRGNIKGGTRTDLAMNLMMDQFQADPQQGRKQVAILLTDGRATADLTAMIARLQTTDIKTIAVGIGAKADEEELRSIATGDGDSNVYIASDFDILKGAVRDIVSQSCT